MLFFFTFLISCTFWTLDTLLRSSNFTKVLKKDLKTKYHMGWSQSSKAKDSHSNIGQKIQYSQLSIFSNCLLKYTLSKHKKEQLSVITSSRKCFSFHFNLQCPNFGQRKIKVKFLCTPFSNTLKHFLRYGKEVKKIFDFIFRPAETFFGIRFFLENFLGYCIRMHFRNFLKEL